MVRKLHPVGALVPVMLSGGHEAFLKMHIFGHAATSTRRSLWPSFVDVSPYRMQASPTKLDERRREKARLRSNTAVCVFSAHLVTILVRLQSTDKETMGIEAPR